MPWKGLFADRPWQGNMGASPTPDPRFDPS